MPDVEFTGNLDELLPWLEAYLDPQNGDVHRAHQFTINGVTYPFVRDGGFAAVPDPHNFRRYSMLAGVYLVRPGDLMYFFQADPPFDGGDVDNRRGLRGIWLADSEPFTDRETVTDSTTGYTVLGECPSCGTFHSTMADKCVICSAPYPTTVTPSRPDGYQHLVLGLRLLLKPLVVFKRSVSDERAYADMRDPVLLWVGRHDNAMGPGKGSSIRQLLAHEAIKLARLMISEPDQALHSDPPARYPNAMEEAVNDDETPVEHLEIERRPQAGDRLQFELMLNFHIARTIDDPDSSIRQALAEFFENGILEYASSEFPYGYTAGQSDFVCMIRVNESTRRLIVMEFKRDWIDDTTVIQASLYVPWVVQTIVQFAEPSPSQVEVIPVVVGRRLSAGTCSPAPYDYNVTFMSGMSLDVPVGETQVLIYEPTGIYSPSAPTWRAQDVEFTAEEGLPTINWTPPTGTVTTPVEMDWVRDSTWSEARTAAGLST